MSNVYVTKFGNIQGIDPAIVAYVVGEINAATQDLVIQAGATNVGSIARYSANRTVSSTPYTMPNTVGVDGQVLVVSGGNIVYGSGPDLPNYIPDLTVTTLAQGSSAILKNYIFPTQPPLSGVEQTLIFDNRYIQVTLGSNDTFNIGATGPSVVRTVVVPPATYPLADLLNYLQQQFDLLYVAPNNILFSYVSGTDIAVSCFGNLINIIVRDVTSTLANYLSFQTGQGQTRTASVPLSIKQNPAVGRFNIVGVPVSLQSPSDLSSITCTDLGTGGALINAIGDWNYALGNLADVGSLSTSASTLNITTPTTQISNGNSDITLKVDGNDRLIITPTDYTSLRTTTADTRIDLDNTGIFMAFQGNTVFYTLFSSTRIWSPNTINKLTLDNTFISLDYNNVEKFKIDGTGIKLNGAYTMPNTDGAAGQIMQTDGSGNVTFQTPTALNPFNQNLNTSDNVTFSSVFTDTIDSFNNLNIGGINALSVTVGRPATITNIRGTTRINSNYELPTTLGTAGQVLTVPSVGTTAIWATPEKIGVYSQLNVITVANTNGENSITGFGVGSLTLAPNYLQNGVALSWNGGGTFRNNAINTDIRWRLRNNGVAIFDSGNLTMASVPAQIAWNLSMTIVFIAPNNFITNFTWSYSSGSDGRGFTVQQSFLGIDPTIANTLALSVQWVVASANNTITSNHNVVTKIY